MPQLGGPEPPPALHYPGVWKSDGPARAMGRQLAEWYHLYTQSQSADNAASGVLHLRLCIQGELVCLQQILHELHVLYHASRLHIILRMQPWLVFYARRLWRNLHRMLVLVTVQVCRSALQMKGLCTRMPGPSEMSRTAMDRPLKTWLRLCRHRAASHSSLSQSESLPCQSAWAQSVPSH